MKRIVILLCSIFLLSFFLSEITWANPNKPIYLRTENGAIINPITGANIDQPVSPKKTCGECHPYETITKAYHFQLGRENLNDQYDPTIPWIRSPGMFGRYIPYTKGIFSQKINESSAEIDMTPYIFATTGDINKTDIPGCAGCHAGGGGLEFDRDGKRYDQRQSENPGLAVSLDGDYHNAKWHRSGVIEADCFICHIKGYDYEERIRQLKLQNLKWAATAGAKFGQIYNSVKENMTPQIIYNRRFFNDDGRVSANIIRADSANCLYCHTCPGEKKRGIQWKDKDIHYARKIECSQCHQSGMDHNFAKGDDLHTTLGKQFENTIKNCRECHDSGYLGAPKPEHTTIRPNHLDKIDCKTCHIPYLTRAAGDELTVFNGENVAIPKMRAKEIGDEVIWYPTFDRNKEGRIIPINEIKIKFFVTNKEEDGKYYPLYSREITGAFKNNIAAEPRTEAEIFYALTFLKNYLENGRFRIVQPVIHIGRNIYYIEANNKLVKEEDKTWVQDFNKFSISHGITPISEALGANGCTDCHSKESHFFTQIVGNSDLFSSNFTAGFTSNLLHNRFISLFSVMMLIFLFLFVLKNKDLTILQKIDFPIGFFWLQVFSCGILFFYNKTMIIRAVFENYSNALNWHIISGMIFLMLLAYKLVISKKKIKNHNSVELFVTAIALFLLTSGIFIFFADNANAVKLRLLHGGSALIFIAGTISLSIKYFSKNKPSVLKTNKTIKTYDAYPEQDHSLLPEGDLNQHTTIS